MPLSIISRAAVAATLLVSTVSAGNLAVYWGQGNGNRPLAELCADPSVKIVNLAFVTEFPKHVGDYPKTNFGNACWGDVFTDPETGKDTPLLKTCPTIAPGIQICRDNRKKVLLSLGGGAAPADYSLPNESVALWFAQFLVGAFGPPSKAWIDAGKPRPFGDMFVDGFDLDLEADAGAVGTIGLSAHYGYFVNQLKAIQPNLLISAAPQCEVPDVRLADAISKAPFDFIFTQFYNTPKCSARLGYQQRNSPTTGFSFNQWADWIAANSYNKNARLFIGLPAGPDGAGEAYRDHYLKPEEANALVTKWSALYPDTFGGIMLWEAAVSANNKNNCQTYNYWMRSILDGTFAVKYPIGCALPSTTSSVRLSTSSIASSTSKATPSSTAVSTSASSSIVSTTKSASSSIVSSTSKSASSSVASSTSKSASTSGASSTSMSTSSSVVSSTSQSTSPSATSASKSSSSSIASSASSVVSSSASASVSTSSSVASSSAYSTTASSSAASSSAASSSVVSSSAASSFGASSSVASSSVASSSVASSSAASSSATSSSVSPTSSSTTPASSSAASSVVGSSSTIASSSTASSSAASSSVASSSAVGSSSAVPSSSSVLVSSSASFESSSVSATASASSTPTPESSSHSVGVTSSMQSSSATSSVIYPVDTTAVPSTSSSSGTGAGASSTLYPSSSSKQASSASASNSQVSSVSASSTPAASSTPCTTSSIAHSSSIATPVYNVSSTYGVPGAASSTLLSTLSSGYIVPSSSSVYVVPSSNSVSVASSSTNVPVHGASSSAGSSSTPCSTSGNVYATVSSSVRSASSSSGHFYVSPSSSVVPVGPSSSAYPVAPVSSSIYVYTASSMTSAYPVAAASSKAPDYPAHPQSSKLPAAPSSTTKVITTTYIDSCSTGLTTVTATITKTVCNTCAQPTQDSVTSVYVCHNCGPSIVTVTITKPYTMPATGVPSYPTYTVVVPAKPASSTYGGDNKPSPSAQASSSVYAVDATASQPPAQPSMSSTPSSVSGKPYMPVYSPAVPEQPKKQVSTTISIVIVTPVPVAATLVPYPSAPAGAKNGTMGYPTATGTGAPTKPTSYVPPQFEGAANRLYVGLTGLTAVVAGLLVL